jgi:F0F1-type ATP synthase assembly protein I
MLWMIVVPFRARKFDLLIPSRVFYLGSAIYVGYASVDVSLKPATERLRMFKGDDFNAYMLGALAFFIPLVATHTLGGLHAKATARKLNPKWPQLTPKSTFFIGLLSAALAIFFFIRIPVPVVGQIAAMVGNKSIAFAIVVAYCGWFHDRSNPVWAANLVGLLAFGLIASVMFGSGRRTMLSVILAIPIAWYWLSMRYQPSRVAMSRIFVFGFCGLCLISAYSGIRHRDRNSSAGRTISFAIDSILLMPQRLTNFDQLGELARDQVFGQRAAEFSMLCRIVYVKGAHPVKPFHTLTGILLTPVPRALWPSKPEGLGYTLPRDSRANTRATWGPGIVGHGYHDGGIPVLIVYGLLGGFLLRTMDEFLLLDPSNPFAIGIFASISTHLIGWTRGDCVTFSVQLIAGILAGVAIGKLCVIFFSKTTNFYAKR